MMKEQGLAPEACAPPAAAAARRAAPAAPAAAAKKLDDSCLHFLSFAGVMNSANSGEADACKTVAACLETIAVSSSRSKEGLAAAMLLMEPPQAAIPAGP